ncbi:hypothetical protein EYF80_022600 [Liparis tanakae]|uniref:Uncharacterized protein n=1 Tax=Liparis tanakae TaxID=230148 RepID=A0A4Z2HQ94_9TELE|nr:hypothetical protein EYF80_022600 [Liparis tanakae]
MWAGRDKEIKHLNKCRQKKGPGIFTQGDDMDRFGGKVHTDAHAQMITRKDPRQWGDMNMGKREPGNDGRRSGQPGIEPLIRHRE